MALILAIEPDVTQAVILRQVISELVPADLYLVDSKAAALSALEKNVPALILISALLPAHEEQELVACLRTTAELAHQQTLMIPRLASPTDDAASGKRSFFKREAPGELVGCDPRIFAKEVCAYLMRVLEIKAAAASAVAEPVAGVQAPVKAKQKPRVTANATKSQGAPRQGARPPVVPGRVPPVKVTKQPLVTGNAPPSQAARPPVVPSRVPPLEVTKQPLVTANTAQGQEAPSHDAQPPVAPNPVPPVGVKPEPLATTSPSHFASLQRFAERMGTEHSAEQREEKPRQAAPWSLGRQRAGASLSSLASTLGTRLSQLFVTDMGAPDDSVKVARPPEKARPTTKRATAPEPPVPVAKPSQRPSSTPTATQTTPVRPPHEPAPLSVRPTVQPGPAATGTGMPARTQPVGRAPVEVAPVGASLDLTGASPHLPPVGEGLHLAPAGESLHGTPVPDSLPKAPVQQSLHMAVAALQVPQPKLQARRPRHAAPAFRDVAGAPLQEQVARLRQMRAANRSPRKKLLVVAASAFLAVVVVQGVTSPSTPWFEGALPSGELHIETRPAGIEAFVDDEPVGYTPLNLSLEPGAHMLELRYRSSVRRIPLEITEGTELSENVSLFEDRQLGHFEVMSQPSQASVYLDGELRGVTPLTVSNMPVGSHTLILRSSAGTVRKTIRIESDHTTSLIEMIYPGWLAVFSEIPLEVRAARRFVGRTEDGRIRMPPGRHEFELTNARFGYRSTHVLQVSPGQVTPLTVDLPSGIVEVDVQPWGEVWVEDKRIGQAPLESIAVPIGAHEIRVTHPELGERRLYVDVTLTEPLHLTFDFTK